MHELKQQDLTLKAAVRNVLDDLGGIDGAESAIGGYLQRAQLSKCASNSSEQMLSIGAVWRLERAADARHITATLASMHDMALVPRTAAVDVLDHHDLLSLAAHIGAEAGDVLRVIADAGADGNLCAADLARARKELHEAAAAIAKAIAAVSAEELRRQQS